MAALRLASWRSRRALKKDPRSEPAAAESMANTEAEPAAVVEAKAAVVVVVVVVVVAWSAARPEARPATDLAVARGVVGVDA
jgi:hypothetical protein